MEALLRDEITKALGGKGGFLVASLEDLSKGDYYTNAALVFAKTEGKDPRALAEELKDRLVGANIESIDSIEVAGPGFLNFRLKRIFFNGEVERVGVAGSSFGKGAGLQGEKIMIEYTQPNPFKEFHIGHLMNNVVGEALSRLIESEGAEVKRATYHGDVGLQIAKALKGMMLLAGEKPSSGAPLAEQVAYLGKAYAAGSAAYEEGAAEEIKLINKKIYDRSDAAVNELYGWGRKVSFDHFGAIYQRLGSAFDFHFYESESGPRGKELVLANTPAIFEESEGAVIFRGENYGLHTRVFLNKEGLPTYEAKDLGLVELKERVFPFTRSITVTAAEQSEYFKVVKIAIGKVFPKYAGKVEHVAHGMLRLTTGKMSSRTGDVIPAETLIEQVASQATERMDEFTGTPEEKQKIAEQVAIGAIKYTVLRQAPGKDIIFDPKQALSLEGDSGPYLQYTLVRAKTLLTKALKEGVVLDTEHAPEEALTVERLLPRFPEVVARSAEELAPQYIVTYLTEVASAFNSFYASTRVIGSPHAGYYLAVTQAVTRVLENGLSVLGIPTPSKM